jgi:hypothetical protein
MRVMAAEPACLRVRDVHARVELLLGEPVSWGSVKATLNRLSKGSNPRFARISHGRYRISQHGSRANPSQADRPTSG